MADTIEYYISNFKGEEIDQILSNAQLLYNTIYEQDPEGEGTAVFMKYNEESPAWVIIPNIEEVKI